MTDHAAIRKALAHLERGHIGPAQIVLHGILGDFDNFDELQREIEAELSAPVMVCAVPLNPVSQNEGGD